MATTKSCVKIIVDENISPKLVKIFELVRIKTLYQFSGMFASGTPDEKWVPLATNRDFVCLTFDRKMLTAPLVVPAITSCGAKMIFLSNKLQHKTIREQVIWMLKHWNKIEKYASAMKSGSLAKVNLNGRITRVNNYE